MFSAYIMKLLETKVNCRKIFFVTTILYGGTDQWSRDEGDLVIKTFWFSILTRNLL